MTKDELIIEVTRLKLDCDTWKALAEGLAKERKDWAEQIYREGFEAGDTYRRTMECPTARPLDANVSWLKSKTYKELYDSRS